MGGDGGGGGGDGDSSFSLSLSLSRARCRSLAPESSVVQMRANREPSVSLIAMKAKCLPYAGRVDRGPLAPRLLMAMPGQLFSTR